MAATLYQRHKNSKLLWQQIARFVTSWLRFIFVSGQSGINKGEVFNSESMISLEK